MRQLVHVAAVPAADGSAMALYAAPTAGTAPAQTAAAAESQLPETPHRADMTEHANEPGVEGRILVVDDNQDNIEIIATRLRYRGYEILEASDGEQALALVRSAGAVVDATDWAFPDYGNIVSFGSDGLGELYILTTTGSIYRIEAALICCPICEAWRPRYRF